MTSRFAFLAIGCALLLSGCNPTTVGIAASPLFVEGKQTNLLNQSYAAVDSITVQTKQKFPERSTLRIAQLEEIVDTSKKRVIRNPELGVMMTDQIRSRFEQLGYPVVEGKEEIGVVTSGTHSRGMRSAASISSDQVRRPTSNTEVPDASETSHTIAPLRRKRT